MKRINLTSTLFIILFSFSGCIKDVELNLNNTNREYVLSCILNTTQDTVVAQLTKTRDITSKTPFEAVKNAEIILFENYKEVGHFTYAASSAYYLLYHPEPGKTYQLEATIGDNKIWGETNVPNRMEASIEKLTSSMDGYQVSFKDNRNEDNFYWVSATGYERMLDTTYKDTFVFYTQKNIAGIILSNFEYADDFNRYISENGVYKFEYDYYIRFSDNQLPEDLIQVNFNPMTGLSPEIFFLSTDYNLDKYMKSSLLLERMDLNAEDMPIIYSPQPVYSNIHGGTGIFGSLNSISKKYPDDY